METKMILHILRNPHGWSEEDRRKAMLAAADEIEKWKTSFENVRDAAIKSGVDIYCIACNNKGR